MPMKEISLFEQVEHIFTLEPQGLDERHEDFMGPGPFGASVLVGAVPEDHIRENHPFGQVVVERDRRVLKEGDQVKPVPEETFGKALEVFILIVPHAPKEKAFLDTPHPSFKPQFGKKDSSLIQPQGILEDALKLPVIVEEFRASVFLDTPAQFPKKMDQALLHPAREPGVGGIEIRDEDAAVVFRKDAPRDFRSPAFLDSVIGEPFTHKGPEPVPLSIDLPARLIDMDLGALMEGFEDLTGFDFEPLAHPLEGLGHSAFRDPESCKLPEKLHDLISRKGVVILEDRHLNEGMGSDEAMRHFLGGIRSGEELPTIRAIVTMPLKKGDFDPGRDDVFLDVFEDFLRGTQGMVAIWASLKGLFHDSVDPIRSRASHPKMPRFLAGFLCSPYLGSQTHHLKLSPPEIGLFLFLELPFELSDSRFSFLNDPLFFEDDLDEGFLGFLSQEKKAVFHNPFNGFPLASLKGVTSRS